VRTDTEKSILVVDHHHEQAAALSKQLEFAGFKTQFTYTGTGAINKIKEHLPDLVILNVSLSDMDALEVVSFIRNHSNNCLIPVIAMSALPHMKDRSLRGGCSDFFQKPVKVLDLVVRIRKALR
jgi:CheY-like chemotaxis protein